MSLALGTCTHTFNLYDHRYTCLGMCSATWNHVVVDEKEVDEPGINSLGLTASPKSIVHKNSTTRHESYLVEWWSMMQHFLPIDSKLFLYC